MLVARDVEKALLRSTLDDEYSQFVAIYGRRRVGKTFLVRESFDYQFTFQHSGVANSGMHDQLYEFSESLKDAGLRDFERPRSWLEAFGLLKDLIRESRDKKKVIFIDELSWMDTPGSGLVTALESFWNGWASARKDIVLIVCASTTSWMLNKIVHNKGGLYNRLTKQIALKPFTLGQCEQFLQSKGIELTRHQILEGYMIMGGIPYYWDFFERGKSLSQNVDALFFAENAPLAHEFDYLYASLFKNPKDYLAIVSALGKHKVGMTRGELLKNAGVGDTGAASKKLAELESCGFIRRYRSFNKKSKGSLYQLMDNFTLFYFKFLADGPRDDHFWEVTEDTSRRNAWRGLAFERVCLQHVPQIKEALGVRGVLTEVNSWSCKADPGLGIHGSQIDLLIVRRDQVINLCEMKYVADTFAITKKVDESLRHKVSDFKALTKTKSAVHVTIVTTYGLARNEYWGRVQQVVTADDLFA